MSASPATARGRIASLAAGRLLLGLGLCGAMGAAGRAFEASRLAGSPGGASRASESREGGASDVGSPQSPPGKGATPGGESPAAKANETDTASADVRAEPADEGDAEREQRWREREAELLARIAELERALDLERDMRAHREREWLEFTRLLSYLDVPDRPEAPGFLAALDPPEEAVGEGGEVSEDGARADSSAAAPDSTSPGEQGAPSAPSGALDTAVGVELDPLGVPRLDATRAAELAARRSAAVLRDLRAFLMADQVDGLDLLEIGVVGSGWTGPVVARLVDEYGRPTGTLAADRLRLEASLAAHSLTLVFENGYEVREGRRVPFGQPERPGDERGGVRRLYLAGVDPTPWMERFPELFAPGSIDTRRDDGRHDLLRLRLDLNNLLRNETRSGHWRLAALGGVRGDVWQDVQIVELGEASRNRVLRRLFADRMRVLRREAGVELLLEGGVQERAGRRAPFLEGRYRIILPNVHFASWEEVGLPGWSRAGEATSGEADGGAGDSESGDGESGAGEAGAGESGDGEAESREEAGNGRGSDGAAASSPGSSLPVSAREPAETETSGG